MFDVLITGGRVVDGTGLPWTYADVAIQDGRIVDVGRFPNATAKQHIDATGLVVAPGMVDTHVHGDLPTIADPYHEAAIRQGVTTYVVGQDGVAFAPASAKTMDYMRRYTAGFNGIFEFPDRSWSSVDEYLSGFDNRAALNICTLIPNGNVRMEVMGLETRKATTDELKQMKRIVREGMEQGAVGVSSGLDYIPSLYADTDELVALCEEITPYGGVYVSHMRGYSADVLPHTNGEPAVVWALREMEAIQRRAGCAIHVSHMNTIAEVTLPHLDWMIKNGVDVTYDLYCYLWGSTILGMISLPPEVQTGGIEATMARLGDPKVREELKAWFANPRVPLETIRLGCVPAPEWKHYEGKTLSQAAALAKMSIGDFICDALIATGMATNTVVPHHKRRTEADVVALMRHPAMMGGSDGIFLGGYPHPRGTGCYAKYLGHYVRNGDWTLEHAVSHLSHHGAKRHGLKDRGLIVRGYAADVVVFDAATIADRSTYDDGHATAVGMQHVIVNGVAVLLNGERTKALPGRGLRRG